MNLLVINSSCLQLTASLSMPACLTLGAVHSLPREDLGAAWTLSYLQYADEAAAAEEFGTGESERGSSSDSHWSRSDEAISKLKWHKSDGRKTNWPHMYVSPLSMGSLGFEHSGKRQKHFEDKEVLCHSILPFGKIDKPSVDRF